MCWVGKEAVTADHPASAVSGLGPSAPPVLTFKDSDVHEMWGDGDGAGLGLILNRCL